MSNKCVYCGNKIVNKRSIAKFCSSLCAGRYRNKGREHVFISRVKAKCKVCGRFFVKKAHNHEVCSDCSVHYHKKRISDYGKNHRKTNRETRIKYANEYYRKNKISLLKKSQEYSKKNRVNINKISRDYEKRHPGKVREIKLLRQKYGTSFLGSSIKKNEAVAHIGSRIVGRGNTIKINKEDIPEIINRIEKGETYAAYE